MEVQIFTRQYTQPCTIQSSVKSKEEVRTTVPVTNSADAIQNFSLEETGLEVRYKQVSALLIIVQG